jgi:hypothetical protein
MSIEKYFKFSPNFSHFPNIPWDMDPQHLERIEREVQETDKNHRSIEAIGRTGVEYSLISSSSPSWNLREYFHAVFNPNEGLKVLYSKDLGRVAVKIAKDTKKRNEDDYQKSPLRSAIREIPIDRRTLVELREELGVKVTSRSVDNGVPSLVSCQSLDSDFSGWYGLRRRAFQHQANHIVGYQKRLGLNLNFQWTYSPSKTFPQIVVIHSGYPVLVEK